MLMLRLYFTRKKILVGNADMSTRGLCCAPFFTPFPLFCFESHKFTDIGMIVAQIVCDSWTFHFQMIECNRYFSFCVSLLCWFSNPFVIDYYLLLWWSAFRMYISTIFMIIKMGKMTMMMMMHLVNRKLVLLNLHTFHLVSIWQRVDYELCRSIFCFTLWTKLFQKYTEHFPRSVYCLAFEIRHGESVKFSTNNNMSP